MEITDKSIIPESKEFAKCECGFFLSSLRCTRCGAERGSKPLEYTFSEVEKIRAGS